jgi:tetraacyldisaccharide 4'-kinase
MKRPLLLPLAPLYAAGLALRQMRLDRGWERVRRLRDPVISIGNLSTGGSGKTPLVIALARSLTKRGFSVDVLSRGYGRTSRSAARVMPDGTAEEFGDEPLLIAREAGVPVFVASERYQAGQLAEADGEKGERPRVHILDDGFQHRQLARDVDVVLVNSEDLLDSLLPAGNLREPLASFNRATVLAIPADDPEAEQFFTDTIPIDRNSKEPRWTGPLWRVRRRMEVPQVDGPVAAFCGIARPKQFFAGLEAAGLKLAIRTAFPDHHRYTDRDVQSLIAGARAASAKAFLTTEKDAVRMEHLASRLPTEVPLRIAGLRNELSRQEDALDWICARLGSAGIRTTL